MRVALVTGASSGIGAAIAIAFAENGWSVMAAGRDEGRLEEVADISDEIATWIGDLADAADCEELVADTIDEFGNLDCLVNAAGIYPLGTVDETDEDTWRRAMAINLDVPFFLSRAALPHLARTAGSIVNIASYYGLRGGERVAAYAAGKGGLLLLTRCMALDHGREGVRVNAVCPGSVDTPMLTASAAEEGMDIDEFLEREAEASPNGRIAEPEDVAALVLFLAGESARHITGAAIPVDGGLQA